MPIYEYECKQCGHRLEAMQKMSDDPLTKCSACGQSTLTKLISAVGFRLKGSGWYETDFKNGNKKNVVTSEPAKSKSESSTSESESSTSKPESSTSKSESTQTKKSNCGQCATNS